MRRNNWQIALAFGLALALSGCLAQRTTIARADGTRITVTSLAVLRGQTVATTEGVASSTELRAVEALRAIPSGLLGLLVPSSAPRPPKAPRGPQEGI